MSEKRTTFDFIYVIKLLTSETIKLKKMSLSLSITPSDIIRKHPTNNSTSKQVYRFPKSPRFASPNPECPNAFYTFDSQLSKRKTGFGYGEKLDFTQTITVSPAANTYSLKSFVDENKNKTTSFGTPRQKMPDRSYIMPQLQNLPGPGTYQNDKQKRSNYSFSVRPKTLDFIGAQLTFKQTPGPGTHQDINMEPKKGRFSVSKYADSPLSTIHPKTQRFATLKQSPGPGSYFEGDCLNGEGKYILSKRKSNGCRVFSKNARNIFWKGDETPGPGSYIETSEFGHYGNSEYYKGLNK